MRMNDLDAICLLKELQDYNFDGRLITPQNNRPDTFWTCTFDHAIRALMERLGLKDDDVGFTKNPNGSYTAHAVIQSGKQTGPQAKSHIIMLRYDQNGERLSFCYKIDTPPETGVDMIKSTIALHARSDEMNDAVFSACQAKNWKCEVLGANRSKIPIDILLLE